MTYHWVIAHSPDSDDAYMMAPLALGWLDPGPFQFSFVREDIEVLNARAESGLYEVTAISFGAYPVLKERYDLLTAGSSIQEGTGPVLVGRRPLGDWLTEMPIAIPGFRTSAYRTLMRWNTSLRVEPLPFDQILPAVTDGRYEAGLLIHESQLQYQALGLHALVDLGAWWKATYNLPLPMGGNAIRRDLPGDLRSAFADLMTKSVQMALERHAESVDYAQSFGRGMPREMVDRYVQGWVNGFTVHPGTRGQEAVRLLLDLDPVWVGPTVASGAGVGSEFA